MPTADEEGNLYTGPAGLQLKIGVRQGLGCVLQMGYPQNPLPFVGEGRRE